MEGARCVKKNLFYNGKVNDLVNVKVLLGKPAVAHRKSAVALECGSISLWFDLGGDGAEVTA